MCSPTSRRSSSDYARSAAEPSVALAWLFPGGTIKVVINAASAKMGGAVTYITHLLRHLPTPDSGHQFLVILPAKTAEAQKDIGNNVKLLPAAVGDIGGWERIWWEHVTLRRLLKRERADLLFSAANFAMFFCPAPQILLIQNALYFSPLYRQMFLARHGWKMKLAFRLRRSLMGRSARSADRVMTPTQAALEGLSAAIDLPPRKTFVNPYGIPDLLAAVGPVCSGALAEHDGGLSQREGRVADVFGLLYVSLYAEHKNLQTALKALALLNQSGSANFNLVTTVDPAWNGASWTVTAKADQELAHKPEITPWVKFVGPLDRRQTQRLYGEADIFVFPSLVESFGLPLVEAMGQGLPIVAADTPVNREICADAALYFSPLDPEDLSRQVQLLASDARLRQRLAQAGLERVRTHFRWDIHVACLMKVCESLVGTPA